MNTTSASISQKSMRPGRGGLLAVCLTAGALGSLWFPAAGENDDSVPGSVSDTVPVSVPSSRWQATTREQARQSAQERGMKSNPFAPIPPALRSYPKWAEAKKQHSGESSQSRVTKPPSTLIPPPPPTVAGIPGQESEALSVDELPDPPAKPALAPKLKLVGLIGERAIFTLDDTELRMANRWPYVISLSPGESFESVKLVAASEDDVTIEESGQQTLVDIPRIK
ncbi:MAG TPA: hypothetical protein V6C72_19175 [Chroococcales cyanobacterium]